MLSDVELVRTWNGQAIIRYPDGTESHDFNSEGRMFRPGDVYAEHWIIDELRVSERPEIDGKHMVAVVLRRSD